MAWIGGSPNANNVYATLKFVQQTACDTQM